MPAPQKDESPQRVFVHETERYHYATRQDLPLFSELLSDPVVGRWLWFSPLPPEAVEAYFGPFVDRQQKELDTGTRPTTAVFTVEDTKNAFLGHGAVVEVEGSPGGFEIGFQLMRDAWGRGVGSRLGRFLCAYAIECCSAYRIEGGCLEGNLASANLLRKLGLELEGTRPGYRLKQNDRHTELCFGVEVSRLDLGTYKEVARSTGLRTR